MRHRKMRRKLGVTSDHRKSLLRNLAKSLVLRKRIQTTHARAKEASAYVDKMVTLAKKGDLHARRLLIAKLGCSATANALITEIAPKFQDRQGGYTRVLKLGHRPGDGAEKSLLEFTAEFDLPVKKKKVKKEETSVSPSEEKGSSPKAADESKGSDATATPSDANREDPEKKGGFMGTLRKFLKGD